MVIDTSVKCKLTQEIDETFGINGSIIAKTIVFSAKCKHVCSGCHYKLKEAEQA